MTQTLLDVTALRPLHLETSQENAFMDFSLRTRAHTPGWPAEVSVVCTDAVSRSVQQCNCFAVVNPLTASPDSLWFCFELNPVYTHTRHHTLASVCSGTNRRTRAQSQYISQVFIFGVIKDFLKLNQIFWHRAADLKVSLIKHLAVHRWVWKYGMSCSCSLIYFIFRLKGSMLSCYIKQPF